jgi:hypothetical protein
VGGAVSGSAVGGVVPGGQLEYVVSEGSSKSLSELQATNKEPRIKR